MLEFIVDDNTVLRKYDSRPYQYKVPMYSQNAIEIHFEFDDTWIGYTYTAQLTKDISTYNLLLDASNKIFIPSDITEGIWYVSVFGVKGTATRNTTISATINVVRGGYVTSGTPPVPPTPDLYQQLISQVETSETNAKASEVAAAQSLQDVNVASTAAISKMETYGDTRYANALIGDKSGTLVNVDDAWGVKALKAGVDGKSAQVVTTGKNICPVKGGSNEGVTATVNADGSMTLNGTATDVGYITLDGGFYSAKVPIAGSLVQVGKKYCMSGSIASKFAVRLVTYSETGEPTTIFGSGTVPVTDLYYGMFLYTYAGASFANTVVYPQIEQAEVATAWEPYTGGKPSPSPEYPQEVDVIDSPVSVQATGKNLFNVADKLHFGISFSTNENGIRLSGKSTYPHANVRNTVASTNLSGKTCILSCSALHPEVYATVELLDIKGITLLKVWADTVAKPVVIPEKTASIMFNVGVRTAGTELDFIVKPQVELGSTATAYEPYTSNNQTITLPSDHNYLASLPDGTRDELVLRADGVAVLTERVGKVVFDGSSDEAWKLISTKTSGKRRFGSPEIADKGAQPSSDSKTGSVLCNLFVAASNNSTYNRVEGISELDTSLVFYHAEINDTVTNWKSWLAANPVTVYYKLATPATSYSADNGATWSTTDPSAGNSAIQLYKGTNNVWCTDALSPNTNLEYVQDTNAVIKKLSAAIVAAGATGV